MHDFELTYGSLYSTEFRRRRIWRGKSFDHSAVIARRRAESAWLTLTIKELEEITQQARRQGLWVTTDNDVDGDHLQALFLNGASVGQLSDLWEISEDAVEFRLRCAGVLTTKKEKTCTS